MQLQRRAVSELQPAIKLELQRRVDREFGEIPIVREHVWAEPTWAFLAFVDEKLVSFLNIVDRVASADGHSVRLFGLNNVITEPEHRGKGYSTALNRAALEFMKQEDSAASGFLFCADDLMPFYSGLGWKKFDGAVTVSQPSGEKLWQSNAMVYHLTGSPSWKQVNLCGLPW